MLALSNHRSTAHGARARNAWRAGRAGAEPNTRVRRRDARTRTRAGIVTGIGIEIGICTDRNKDRGRGTDGRMDGDKGRDKKVLDFGTVC